jgi:MoaA/NifB/PqqE/SkfB family radical SAM enzyme
MNIKEVKQNWPKDTLRVDITLSNICNYKCWYCFPGCNDGTYKWPDFDLYVKNVSQLLDYYLEHTNKTKFDFHIMGGEVTHWKRFFDLIVYFKERYNCIFTLTTNGAKKVDWWIEAAPYLDYVTISSHHEFTDPVHVRDVADALYENNTIVNTVVLMDPLAWDKCVEHINVYKTSRRKWSIKYLEIINQPSITYTPEQLAVLKGPRARGPNIFWFLRNNKSYMSKVSVVDENNKRHKVSDEEVVISRLNNFKGWQCDLGVEWIAIKMDGSVAGICGNGLFADKATYNVLDEDFAEQFQPVIEPTVCEQNECWCMFEANMPKRKIDNNTKKTIPIYVQV